MARMIVSAKLLWIGLILFPSFVTGLKLKATFSMAGIKGTVTFHQPSEGSPTTIKANFTGIKEPLYASIHRLPIIYDGGVHSCHSNQTGGVYDPEEKMSAESYGAGKCNSSSDAKFDECAVGDLGKKHGNFSAEDTSASYTDPAVQLRGRSSVNGRSVVLSRTADGAPVACALITAVEPLFTAKAEFNSPVAGAVYFRQLDEWSDTFVFVDFFRVAKTPNGSFSWRVAPTSVEDTFSSSPEQCMKTVNAIFNPYSLTPNEACNGTNHKDCSVGDLSSKHGQIRVSGATPTGAHSSHKRVFTDSNLPLMGEKGILGRSLVLYTAEAGDVACAKITIVQPQKATAVFMTHMNKGINGSFRFVQASPFDPTIVDIQLSNLDQLVQGYHVHEYPSPAYKNMTGDMSCSGEVAGGHLNPHGIVISQSPEAGTGTNDQYELGDLSGKYGSFLGMMSYNKRHVDYNLPLFGYQSIIGRSVVIHRMKQDGNKRHVCANLVPDIAKSTFYMKTKTEFKGPEVFGMILMDQYIGVEERNMTPSNAMIYIDLKYKNATLKSMNHKWHVHMKPFSDDATAPAGRCASMDGHFNPYHVDLKGDYKKGCCSSNMHRCEAGDLSGKHGMYNIGMGRQYYTDMTVALFGESSVVGRGVVVHAQDAGGPRIACGNTIPDPSLYQEKSLEFVQESKFDKERFMNQIASVLLVPTWRITYVRTERGEKNAQCLKVKFGIIGRADQTELPSAMFDSIVQTSPEDLREFAPSPQCSVAEESNPDKSTTFSPTSGKNSGSSTCPERLLMFILLAAGLVARLNL